MVGIGIASHRLALAADAGGWAVALLCFWIVAVELHQLSEINISVKGTFHRLQVYRMPISSELNPVG